MIVPGSVTNGNPCCEDADCADGASSKYNVPLVSNVSFSLSISKYQTYNSLPPLRLLSC